MREPVTDMTVEEDVLRNIWTVPVRPRRELAHRVNGGIDVTLYWSAHDNSTSLEVWDSASEEMLQFTVGREEALDAFYHPFAHLHYEEQNIPSTTSELPEIRAEP